MIRTNLSTQPFYNQGAVRGWLVALAVVVIAATLFNVSRVIKYSRNDTELGTEASQNERRAAELRASAARLRATVDPKQIDLATAEARQANEFIDRRTFSWTELFNQFETTMPDDVRIATVRPKIDPKRGVVLTLIVVARSVDDVSQLMDNLERTGAFKDLVPPEEHLDDEGHLVATLESIYVPAGSKGGAKQP